MYHKVCSVLYQARLSNIEDGNFALWLTNMCAKSDKTIFTLVYISSNFESHSDKNIDMWMMVRQRIMFVEVTAILQYNVVHPFFKPIHFGYATVSSFLQVEVQAHQMLPLHTYIQMAEVLNVLAVLSVFLVLSSNSNRIYKDTPFPDTRPGNKETDSGDLESHLTNLEKVLDSNTSTAVDDVLHTEER